MTDQRRKAGRPTKPAKAGERPSLGLKVTAEIKTRLDEAARASGRTQSQEAENRLERSFQEELLLPQLLDVAYGRQAAGLLMLLGRCINETVPAAAFFGGSTQGGTENWIADPWTYAQAATAIRDVLDGLRPPGEPEPRNVPLPPGTPAAVIDGLRNIGARIASGMLLATADRDVHSGLKDAMEPVRDRLGESLKVWKCSRPSPTSAALPLRLGNEHAG